MEGHATLGLTRESFDVFKIPEFSARMTRIRDFVRPRLQKLGEELAPLVSRELNIELFAHVAKHARRSVNPPPETWCALGPAARGYKGYPYLALCISQVGLHARVVVKSEARHRARMAEAIRANIPRLKERMAGTTITRYDKWNFTTLPSQPIADEASWMQLAERLALVTGTLDIGFGWPREEALKLSRAHLIEAYVKLHPVFDLCLKAQH